jgi:hypothetical protein
MTRKNFYFLLVLFFAQLNNASDPFDSDEKVAKLIADYKRFPLKVLTSFLNDNCDFQFVLDFWASLFLHHRPCRVRPSSSKYDFGGGFRNEFDQQSLDLIRFTGHEIKYLTIEIILCPQYEKKNNVIFTRLDVLLKLMRKYSRRVVGLDSREKAKVKIEKLSFVLDSIKSNLKYNEAEANSKYLMSVLDEIKFHYPGATLYLKQRVQNLRCLSKCLSRNLFSSNPKLFEDILLFEGFFQRMKVQFDLMYIQKEPRQKILYEYYEGIMGSLPDTFRENFNFLLGKEKNAVQLDPQYLIKISFFGRLSKYLDERWVNPECISIQDFESARFITKEVISMCKAMGEFELYLRRFINDGSLQRRKDPLLIPF